MRIVIQIVILFILASCNQGGIKVPPIPAMIDNTTPIWLKGDTTQIKLTDYFSDPTQIDKINPPEKLKLTISPDKQTMQLIASEYTKPLDNLTFIYDGYKYDVPVLKKNEKNDTIISNVPFIFTEAIKGDTIYLRNQHPVNNWYIYIQNYRLKEKKLIISDSNVAIIIPKEAQKLKTYPMRIWAINNAGCSNSLMIPLEKDQVITNVQTALSYFKPDDIHEKNIKDILANIKQKEHGEITDSNRIAVFTDFCANNMAIRYGDIIPLRIEDDIYAYLYSYFEKDVIIIYNKNKETAILKLNLPKVQRDTDFKALFGGRFSYGNSNLILDAPANDIEIIYN